MKIGLGVTALKSGITKNKLDGIGIYTLNLIKNIQDKQHELLEIDFSYFKIPFNIMAGLSVITGAEFFEISKKYTNRIDIFHATDHMIPKLKKIPVVATVMDIIPIIHPEWVTYRYKSLVNYTFKKTILSADHIITPSVHSKNDICNSLGITQEKVSVVSLGADVEFFMGDDSDVEGTLGKYGINEEYFLFVGTIQPRKNLIRVVKAFKKLSETVKNDFSLIIVGNYGWGADDFLDLISKNHQNINWLQGVTNRELKTIMKNSYGIVYPSLYEGFGLPVLEGFACGVPVIASNNTSIPEVAGDGALLVNPYSVDELAGAMIKIIEDEALRNELIQKGYKQLKKFSWEKCAKEHLDVYEKVLNYQSK